MLCCAVLACPALLCPAGIKGLLKQLKALMPVRLKWVKGHQTGACDHKRGNDEAHRRAQTHRLMICEPLPAGAHYWLSLCAFPLDTKGFLPADGHAWTHASGGTEYV